MVLQIQLVEILVKKIRSIHLLDPLTSTPTNGTNIKSKNRNKKKN